MNTPPQDNAAEQAVLGSMMLAPDIIPEVTDILRGADYYRPSHESIHDAIVALWQRKDPVDMVTVADELRRRDHLNHVGGPSYLHDLCETVGVTANATYHAELVLHAAIARRLADAGARVIQLAHSGEDTAQIAQDAQQAVAEAVEQARTADSGVSIAEAMDDALDWLDTPVEGADAPWPDVNHLTNGLLAGSLITVGARPGHGKSLVAMEVAKFTAQQGKPAHIATLEMSRNEYMARILAGVAKVDLGKVLRRDLSESEWQRVAEASGRVRDLPLVLDDRERQTMPQIRAAARRTERRLGKLGVVCIDYAGLVSVPGISGEHRRLQIGYVSREAKLMAKEFGCPVLLLAQLNRSNTSRSDHTPTVTDLKESGDLEQDSDQVWLLHRADQYAGGEDRMGEVDLIVGKNRNGPAPTTIPLAFQGHYARIVSMV